jgi:uncharacterized RDD family membrane protein YckC
MLPRTPNLLRRFAAIFYDLLLLLSVLFVATALILPFNAGEAFTQHWFLLYLFTLSFLFYGWFWTHGGQTLGLRAWKLQVLTMDQQPISWLQAFLRFNGAIISWGVFGLGFGWSLVEKNKRCWHDVFSKTNIFIKN